MPKQNFLTDELLKRFGERSIKDTLIILQNRIPTENSKYDDLLIMLNEFNEIKLEEINGTSFFEQIQVRTNRVRRKLLGYIRNLKNEDFEGFTLNNGVIKYKDSRDGRNYKIFTVSGQRDIWLGENLKFETIDGSFLNSEIVDAENNIGRLYTFDAAFNACIPGWRLPTLKDFARLRWFLGIPNNSHRNYLTSTQFCEKYFEARGGFRSKEGVFSEYKDKVFFWINHKTAIHRKMGASVFSRTNNDFRPYFRYGQKFFESACYCRCIKELSQDSYSSFRDLCSKYEIS